MFIDEDILAEFNGENLCEDPLEVPDVEVDEEVPTLFANDVHIPVEVLQTFLFS